MKKLLALTIAALLLTFLAAALLLQGLGSKELGRVRATLSPKAAYVADTITYRITVISPKNTEISFEEVPGKWSGLDVRETIDKEKTSLRSKIRTREVRFAAFKPGKRGIEGIKVLARGKGASEWTTIPAPEQILTVKTLIKGDLEAERRIQIVQDFAGSEISARPRDYGSHFIETPVRYRINELRGPKKLLTWKDKTKRGLFMAAGVAGGAFLLWLTFSIRLEPEENIAPLHIKTIGRLTKLRDECLLGKGRKKEFCSVAFDIISEHLKERFKLEQAQLTSAGLLRRTREIGGLTEEQKGFLADRLRTWDLVRYCGQDVPEKELHPDLEPEIKFVEGTKEKNDIS